MEKFKVDSSVYFPETADPGLMKSVEQDAKNQNAFLQSQADYAESISMPGPSITELINQVNEYGAKSDALLANQNPGIPSVGPGYQFDVSKSYNSLAKALATPSLKAKAAPVELGPASGLDRYSESGDFQTFGYVPSLGSEQEYRYGRAMTWSDTVGKALAGGGALAYGTFMEGWKGWGRMTEALFTWDSSKLMGSEDERYQMAKEQEEIFNKYAIYNTSESEDSLLNRQFFGNMLQQSGFAVGAMAQFALETYLTGGVAKMISGAVEGINVGKAIKTAATNAELINNTRKAQNVITNSARITNTLKNLPRAIIPLYGTVQDLTKASKAGAGAWQLGVIGLGGIKRELSSFNMARSEAIFEAASTYKDMQDKLVNEFRLQNNRDPNQQELENIRNTADRASSDNFYTNVGVLSVMNRIQLDNMFKSFNTTRKIFNEGVATFADDVLEVSGKVGDKTVRKVYEKGFFGTLGNVGDISKTFGKKKAAWELTKGFWRGAQKFEGLEGLQELIQNASNEGLSNYYYDLYHGKKGYNSKLQNVLDSVQNPLTDIEGAKTFLMGALTGRLIAPFSYAVTAGRTKLTTEGKQNAAKKAEAINIINTFYSDPTNYIKEQIANVKVQDQAARTMEEAVKNQDRYTFYNAKDSAFAKMVAASIKLDLYDSIKDSLTEFGKEMTPDEFKAAFAIDATEVNRNGVNSFIDKVTKQMDDYFTIYQNLNEKYGNTIIPEFYKNNKPEEYERVKMAKVAQDAAIEMLATNVFKARQAAKRATQLTSEMGANVNIGSSSTELITKLGSEQSLADTIFILNQEIRAMEKVGTLTKEQKDILNQKKEELSFAEKWKDSYVDIMNLDDENYHASVQERAYKTFGDLINHYNKVAKKNVAVSREDIDDNFLKMVDYIMLNRDNKSYIDAMNLLADPYNMNLITDNLINAQIEFGSRMQKEHKDEVNNIPDDPNKKPKPPVPPAPAGPSSSQTEQTSPSVDSWYTYQGKTYQIALDEGMVYMMPTNGNEQEGQIITVEEFNKKMAAGEIKSVVVGTLKSSEKKKEDIPDDLETYLKQQYESVKKAVEGKGQKLLSYEDWKKTAGVALAKRWQKAQEEKKAGNTSGGGTTTTSNTQQALEAEIEKIKQQIAALRSEDGSVPADKAEEFNKLRAALVEAQNKAKRGDNKGYVTIRKFAEGADPNTSSPETLSGDTAKAAEEDIEEIIKQSKTPEQAMKVIRISGFIFNMGDTQLFQLYLQDRMDSNAPEVGNNKQSFPAWRKGEFDKKSEVATDIETKKADIERRRKEELDFYKKDITVKVEKYEGVDDEGETHIVTVSTRKDGTKVIQEKLKDAIPLPAERISGHYQLNLPIENFTSLPKGSLKKVSEETITKSKLEDKINAKYDAELAALEAPVSDVDNDIKAVENAKSKEELIQAAEKLVGINPYDAGAVSMGTRAALLTPGSFEQGKKLFLQEIKGVIDARKKAKLDALKGKNLSATDIETQIAKLEEKRKEELNAIPLAEKKDAVNNANVSEVIPGDKFGNTQPRYIPFIITEEANKNDKLGGQTARQIDQRGGYSTKELDGKLPNWRNYLPAAKEINDRYNALIAALRSQKFTEDNTKDEDTSKDLKDVNQDINKLRKVSIETSKFVNADYQVGLRQISPNNSLANKTDHSEIVEIAPGQFRQERRDVNNDYVFDVATPTFNVSEPLVFRVITEGLDKMTNNITGEVYDKNLLFDKDGNAKVEAFDAIPIGVYANIRGEERLIGTLHEPQWIERKIGNNFVNIAIPEEQADNDYPETVKVEVRKNRELRKQILENFNKNRNFVVKGIVEDKSIGILRITESFAPIIERVNRKIAEGGTDNRHGIFGIVRDGMIQSDINVPVDNLVDTEAFSPKNIANYQGVAVLMLPTPTGKLFPTFIKLPNVSEEQAEFIIEAWKAFTGQTNNPEIVKAVYDAMGLVQSADSFNIGVLRNYINHYITYLSGDEMIKPEDKISRLGNGNDATPGTARLNITNKGGLELQVKEANGNWYSTSEPIMKAANLPADYIAKMTNLKTTVKFSNVKNESLKGINSTEKATILSIKNGKLSKENVLYNQYIMQRAGTFVDKGIASQNNFGDWVYFANPVVKMNITTIDQMGSNEGVLSQKPPVTPPSIEDVNVDRPNKGAQLLAALRTKQLSADQVEEQKKNCSLQDKLKNMM